jgi:hypothetical protein
MKRLEKLNKLAQEANLFRVERLSKGKYIIFDNYSDYCSFRINEGKSEVDYNIYSFDEAMYIIANKRD